jgi:hypothetical protein
MFRRIVQLVLLIAVIFGITSLASAQKLHPKLKKKEKELRSILLVPPKITINKDTMRGSEQMLAESEEVEKAIQKLLKEVLKGKGITVVDNQFTPENLNNNEELRYALTDIQGQYDQVIPKVERKSKDVEKGRFTMGDQVAKVNTTEEVDALVFVRGSGSVATAGKSFLRGGLIGMLTKEGTTLFFSVSIVDGKTGDFLYYDNEGVGIVFGAKFHEKPEEVLKKPLENALKKLPSAAKGAR